MPTSNKLGSKTASKRRKTNELPAFDLTYKKARLQTTGSLAVAMGTLLSLAPLHAYLIVAGTGVIFRLLGECRSRSALDRRG